MHVTFRQGIINYQLPSFLKINRTSINLVVTNTPLLFTIASGTKDYLFTENNTIINAWTSLIPNTDQWIYVDYDNRTAIRKFGITRIIPTTSSIAPTHPIVDQHWFDTINKQMKVWNGTSWIPKIRIILAEIHRGTIPVSISQNSPIFSGTQIGDNTNILTGTILFNNQTGLPLTDNSGKFITTEDNIRTDNTHSSVVKFANTLIEASADQSMAMFTFVTFSDFGHIISANSYTTSRDVPYGIILEDVVVGDITNVITDGIVSSDIWDWSSVGINTPLYCDNTGTITTTPVIPQQMYSALVIDTNTILLTTPRQVHNNSQTLNPMSTTLAGIARLSVSANDLSDPIVVGNNDPRLTSSLQLTGGQMTGPLVLSHNPVDVLEAATKQYVDNNVSIASISTLQDVQITNLLIGQLLSYDGTNWVNVDNSATSSLPNIITPGTSSKVTFNAKGLITATSTLSLTLVGDITASGNVAGPITTVLRNSGVTAGTYNNVTVNNKGIVTLASNIGYLTTNENITISGDVSGTGTNAINLTLNTVPINKGGTGQTTAIAAINALLPTQILNANKSLVTDGTNVSWGDTTTAGVITSGDFSTPGDCIARELVLYGISTSSTPIELLLSGTTKLVLSDNNSWGYDITVVGTRTDGTIGNGTWRFSGNIHRETGAITTAITPNSYDIVVSVSDPNWTVSVTANTTDGSLQVIVIGVDNSNIRWAAFIKTVEIKY